MQLKVYTHPEGRIIMQLDLSQNQELSRRLIPLLEVEIEIEIVIQFVKTKQNKKTRL